MPAHIQWVYAVPLENKGAAKRAEHMPETVTVMVLCVGAVLLITRFVAELRSANGNIATTRSNLSRIPRARLRADRARIVLQGATTRKG